MAQPKIFDLNNRKPDVWFCLYHLLAFDTVGQISEFLQICFLMYKINELNTDSGFQTGFQGTLGFQADVIVRARKDEG